MNGQMKYDYIILGAGVAGLAFAYKVAKEGNSVLILEKEKTIGGLSRTFEYKGFRFDFCAHRFHSGNKDLLEEVKSLVGSSFKKHIKKSRIYMFNRYLKYPFELPNLFRAMGPISSIHASISFGYNSILRKFNKDYLASKEMVSYKDWFLYYFGHKLYTIMCYPYASKIWNCDPSEISADWADQRFQGLKIKEMIKKTFKKIIKLDFSSYSLEDESLAPDGGEFYYGELGAQEIPNAFERALKKYNSEILTETKITKIYEKQLRIDYSYNNKNYSAEAKKAVITTIPLHVYYELIDKKDKNTEKVLKELKYMDIIFIYLFLNKEKISNDHWLYFPDRDIAFNRAVEFKTWSKKMAPEGKTATCLDITCFENDDTWNKTDEQLVKECIDSAEKAKLLKKEEVFDSKVIRVRDAYPFYDLDYEKKLKKIVNFIENSNNIFCLGRTGIFRYNNSDNSIEMGFELAKRLLNKDNRSLLDYTIKKVSY
ncbi:NAD(P)-binding protein [Candidatus Woesearchaeota archaeon]|nr:NAD(P)-binding protein [Candidatus Woesearchaeota archaeon]